MVCSSRGNNPPLILKITPHYSNYGGTSNLSSQPEKESFGSFEPREAKLQEASTIDQLIGGEALKWGEICDVGSSLRKADDFIKLGDIKGELQTVNLRSENRFVIERFEPAAGMSSFGESLNSALELEGTSFMTVNIGFPTNNITGSDDPGGDDI